MSPFTKPILWALALVTVLCEPIYCGNKRAYCHGGASATIMHSTNPIGYRNESVLAPVLISTSYSG